MVTIQQGLREDGFIVSMVKLCRWFGVPRRSVYYRSTKAPAKVTPALAEPIKALIEAEPSFDYRTGGRPAADEQEHGATDLPAPGLASAQAGGGQAAAHRSVAIGSERTGPALVACGRNSSHHTAHSRTAWWSVSSAR